MRNIFTRPLFFQELFILFVGILIGLFGGYYFASGTLNFQSMRVNELSRSVEAIRLEIDSMRVNLDRFMDSVSCHDTLLEKVQTRLDLSNPDNEPTGDASKNPQKQP